MVVLLIAGVGGYFAYKQLTSSSTPANTIIVGMPVPLNSVIGQNMADAGQLAVSQINAAGGVDVNGTSYSFKIVTYDTQEADPSIPTSIGIQGVTSLITSSHANFLIGGYRSDVVLAELSTVAQYKTIYITFGADNGISSFVGGPGTANYTNGGKYIFNGFVNSTNQGNQYGLLPVFLHEAWLEGKIPTNVTNIAYLGEQAAWTQVDIGSGGTSCPLAVAYQPFGLNPVYCNYFQLAPSGGSYGPLMTTLANDGVQAIYMLAAGTETPLLIEDYGNANWGADTATGGQKPLLMGADVMAELNGTTSTNNYFKMTGGAAAGEMTFGWGPTLPVALTPTSLAFYNAFESAYGMNPMFEAGFVYSSFFYLANAIEQAKSLSADLVIPYLEKTDYQGPMGNVTFSPSHGLEVPLAPYPTVPAFGMQWHSNGELYASYSSLWLKPSFPAAAGFQTGSSVTFENYETPTGVEVGNFTVAL